MKYTIEVKRVTTLSYEVEAPDYESARESAISSAIHTDWSDVPAYYMTPDENGEWESV